MDSDPFMFDKRVIVRVQKKMIKNAEGKDELVILDDFESQELEIDAMLLSNLIFYCNYLRYYIII